jgi:antirestriction protein ArdC
MSTVYEIITNRILERIEETGILPWQCPWVSGGSLLEHQNFKTKQSYRGINILILNSMGYTQPYWLTFQQCKELGGTIKKGERGTPVVYFKYDGKKIEVKQGSETKEKTLPPLIKYSTVFNVMQCEGLNYEETVPVSLSEEQKIQAAEDIAQGFKDSPDVVSEISRAVYYPVRDLVNMPHRSYFKSQEEYYCTLFHELMHSTGHEKRLNRKTLINAEALSRGEDYGKEELIAEIGASFLCAKAGISPVTFDNSLSYIKGWMESIKANPKMIIEAASFAQRGADWILASK